MASTPNPPAVFRLPINVNEPVSDDEEAEDDAPPSVEEYEQRYVAFIDILGFKELIRDSARASSHGPAKLTSIFNALNLNFDGFKKDYNEKSQSGKEDADLRVNSFSDFVVVSSLATKSGFNLLLFVIWCVARDWLSKGYLCRGGIAKGSVIHIGGTNGNPGMVFGPAFIEAYQLEQDIADFPRIVLSKSVRVDAGDFRPDTKNEFSIFGKLITKCNDGPMCIDLFAHLRRNGFDFLGTEHPVEAKQFQATLKAQLDHGADIPKWHRKTSWLVNCFNEAITDTDYAGKKVNIDQP
jgi:hypothetical protein